MCKLVVPLDSGQLSETALRIQANLDATVGAMTDLRMKTESAMMLVAVIETL